MRAARRSRVDPTVRRARRSRDAAGARQGAEIGLRTVRIKGLQSTITGWYLAPRFRTAVCRRCRNDRAGRPSRRVGLEWTNYWRLRRWLTADGDLALTHARFRGDAEAGNEIPGALDRVIAAGLTVEPHQRLFGSLRVRHFGPRPLPGGCQRALERHHVVEWRARISRVGATRVVLECFNIFNAAVADIDYFYTSRLPGEPSTGIEDVHTHPALPRSLRLGLQISVLRPRSSYPLSNRFMASSSCD